MKELECAKIGRRIREARKSKGWSQEELAKKCGISLNFIGQIERGTRHMSLDTFARLCRELETNADVLLWGNLTSFETEIQGVWGQAEKKRDNSYSMYVRIMKSVADILSDMPDSKEVRRDMCGRDRYEDHTVI